MRPDPIPLKFMMVPIGEIEETSLKLLGTDLGSKVELKLLNQLLDLFVRVHENIGKSRDMNLHGLKL